MRGSSYAEFPGMRIVPWLVLATSALCGVLYGNLARAGDRPNIVFILADDLGWADLGCYGADLHETPHLDRLARKASRFTEAYAPSPVCSPTRCRAADREARRAARTSPSGPKVRCKGRTTGSSCRLPRCTTCRTPRRRWHGISRSAGYLTALVGKWHLGDAAHYPETHGFDVNIGGTHWGAPQTFFWPYRGTGRFGAEFRYVPHLEFGKPGEYLTDRLTDEAMNVIDRAAGGSNRSSSTWRTTRRTRRSRRSRRRRGTFRRSCDRTCTPERGLRGDGEEP